MRTTQMQPPGNRLGELLAERGEKLSIAAAYCNVDQSTIWRWREGKTPIPDAQKFRLSEYFGVSVPYLMGWDEVPA